MFLMYIYYKFDIRSYTNDNSFHFDTFQLHLFYQNIAIYIIIYILKLQKKLLLISVERDSNNSPHNSQHWLYMI